MRDILLTPDGDLMISDTGDIVLTHSVRQAIHIRLRWFLGEWRFAPDYGTPYFEDVLVKNPVFGRVRQIVRDEVMSVPEVKDVKNIEVSFDPKKRSVRISFEAVTEEETLKEEIYV